MSIPELIESEIVFILDEGLAGQWVLSQSTAGSIKFCQSPASKIKSDHWGAMS